MQKPNFATYKLPQITYTSPRSLRDVVLEEAMKVAGWSMDDKRLLGRMLKGFKGKTADQIRRHMSIARQDGRNQAAYFIYLMGMGKKKPNTK